MRRLQEHLRALGYPVGECDGVYGYLTEEAVAAFQRDHRLRPDGVAGPQVLEALGDDRPRLRRVHVVRRGERLSDIARAYGVSVNALRWMNCLRPRAPLRPGRRLVIDETYVLVGAGNGANPEVLARALLGRRHLLSGLSACSLHCSAEGRLEPREASALRELASRAGWDFFAAVDGERPLGELLAQARTRRRFLQELNSLADLGARAGLLLELDVVPLGAGARLVAACAQIRRRARRPLAVAVPPLPEGWRALMTGLEASALARACDRVILATHRWEHLLPALAAPDPFARVEQWVAHAAREIPAWKLWLGVPLGGCRTGGRGLRPEELLSYREAVAEGFRLGVRPKAAATGFVQLEPPEGGDGRRLVLQGQESFRRFLRLACRFRLGGLYLSPAGAEDRRIWEALADRIKAASPVIQASVHHE